MQFCKHDIEILFGNRPNQEQNLAEILLVPFFLTLSFFLSVCLFTSFYFDRKKEQATTKKDRVTHCLTICENIVAQSLRWEF